jgi:hypothetical protein
MTVMDIGRKLIELVKAGKAHEAIETLYAPDIVSVEAGGPPGQSRVVTGIAACLEKGQQFRARMEVHRQDAEGPFPHDDRFAVVLRYEVTPRAPGGTRTTVTEVALYTVVGDKIAREEFFYAL